MSQKPVGEVEGLGPIYLGDGFDDDGTNGEVPALVMDNGEGCNFSLTRKQLVALTALADKAGL